MADIHQGSVVLDMAGGGGGEEGHQLGHRSGSGVQDIETFG